MLVLSFQHSVLIFAMKYFSKSILIDHGIIMVRNREEKQVHYQTAQAAQEVVPVNVQRK